MKRKYLSIILLASILLGFSSCEKFLEEVPESVISPENYFQSESDAIASLCAVYDAMGSGNGVYYRWYRNITLLMSDEGWARTSGSTDFATLNIYSFHSRTKAISDFWQFTYDAINRANATIENVSQMDLEDSRKNKIVGEARFLRALNYFNLVRLFGPVPLHKTETKSVDDVAIGVSTIEEIYQFILEDLVEAEKYVPIRVRGTSDANGRADLAAVKMLLAKVYMTMAGSPVNDNSKWTLAHQKCIELYDMRDQFGFGLWDTYLDVFEPSNENGKEDIMSIQFQSGYGAPFAGEGSLQHIDNFKAAGGRRGNYINKPTVKLKNMFEENDERGIALPNYRLINGKKYNNGTTNYMFLKYVEQDVADNNTPANDTDKNFPLFRYADLLLMCAETENQVNGPSAFAYECLNEVRTRSEASTISGLTKEEFTDFVLDERMRELSNEGSRLFDLYRYHMFIEEVQEANEIDSSQKPVVPEEKHYFLPYPLEELSFNANIQQREGY